MVGKSKVEDKKGETHAEKGLKNKKLGFRYIISTGKVKLVLEK